MHFFLEKVDFLGEKVDFLVVALKTQAKTATLTTPALQISSASKNSSKISFLPLPADALTTFPCKLRSHFFSALGVHVHPPLATHMFPSTANSSAKTLKSIEYLPRLPGRINVVDVDWSSKSIQPIAAAHFVNG